MVWESIALMKGCTLDLDQHKHKHKHGFQDLRESELPELDLLAPRLLLTCIRLIACLLNVLHPHSPHSHGNAAATATATFAPPRAKRRLERPGPSLLTPGTSGTTGQRKVKPRIDAWAYLRTLGRLCRPPE